MITSDERELIRSGASSCGADEVPTMPELDTSASKYLSHYEGDKVFALRFLFPHIPWSC
jgi:hypothetical protein